MILQQLTGHPHIIQIKEVLKSDNDKDLYIAFDFMDSDIHRVIGGRV